MTTALEVVGSWRECAGWTGRGKLRHTKEKKLTRRIVALIAGAVLLLVGGVAPAMGAMSDIETPTVSGPVAVTADSHPFSATDKDLEGYGYVEQEFKYSGNAYRYDRTPTTDIEVTGTKITTGGPGGDGKFPYTTRMIVRRPADPEDFNGTVVVEWLNVTAGFELEANWFGDPEYLLDNGYAYVGISAQRTGINYLKNVFDPVRYGDLDIPDGLPNPQSDTDGLSFDVYAAGIKALLDGGSGVDPLGPLAKPDTVLASGQSQSGSRLSTYYNKVQPIHDVVDAFLITVSSSALRDDGTAPAIRVLSETENRIPRTEPDTSNYRQWEVAGGSHFPRMAFDNLQQPIERDLGLTLSATCRSTRSLASSGRSSPTRPSRTWSSGPTAAPRRRAPPAGSTRTLRPNPTTSSSATTSASPRAGSGCPRSRSRRGSTPGSTQPRRATCSRCSAACSAAPRT